MKKAFFLDRNYRTGGGKGAAGAKEPFGGLVTPDTVTDTGIITSPQPETAN